MTSVHQNNHEQFTCEQSWHSSEPANYYSFEVTYTLKTLILKHNNAHYPQHTHIYMTLITVEL